MFEKLIESLLGDWGRPVMNFLYENTLIIGSGVIIIWVALRLSAKYRKKSNKNKVLEKQEKLDERD